MNLQIIDEFDKINKNEWENLLLSHPGSSYFQTPQMYLVYSKNKYYSPIIIACFEKNQLVGIMLAFVQSKYNQFLKYLSSRAVIWGGPIVKNNNPIYINEILKRYNIRIKNKAIYTQIRNLIDIKQNISVFANNGFIYEQHLNILIDITKTKETLWKELNSKRRNEIRKAYKSGLKFSLENNHKSLESGYNILLEVYDRAKLPLPNLNFFRQLLDVSKKNQGIKNFVVKKDNKIIGCLIALVYRDNIYDFFAGSYKKFYKYHPNDIIPWEIFLWGKKNNFSIFDFGGAGKPNIPYGVRDYKKKFGGSLVNYGRFQKIHNKFLYKIAFIGFNFWRLQKTIFKKNK